MGISSHYIVAIAAVATFAAVFGITLLTEGAFDDHEEEAVTIDGNWYLSESTYYNSESGKIEHFNSTFEEGQLPYLTIGNIENGMFTGKMLLSEITGGIQEDTFTFTMYSSNTWTTVSGTLFYKINGVVYNALYITITTVDSEGNYSITNDVLYKEGSEYKAHMWKDVQLPSTMTCTKNVTKTTTDGMKERDLVDMTLVEEMNGIAVIKGNYGDNELHYAISITDVLRDGGINASGISYYNGNYWSCELTISEKEVHMDYGNTGDTDFLGYTEFTIDGGKGNYMNQHIVEDALEVTVTGREIGGAYIDSYTFEMVAACQLGNTYLMIDENFNIWSLNLEDAKNAVKSSIRVSLSGIVDNEAYNLVGYASMDGTIVVSGTRNGLDGKAIATQFTIKPEGDSDTFEGTWYLTKNVHYYPDDDAIRELDYAMSEKMYPLVITEVKSDMFYGTFNGVKIVGGIQDSRIQFNYYDASTGYVVNCNGKYMGYIDGTLYDMIVLTFLENKPNSNEGSASTLVLFKDGATVRDVPYGWDLPSTLKGISNTVTYADGTSSDAEVVDLTITASTVTLAVMKGTLKDGSAIECIITFNGGSSDGTLYGIGMMKQNSINWTIYLELSGGIAYIDYVRTDTQSTVGHAEYEADWSHGTHVDLTDLLKGYKIVAESMDDDGNIYSETKECTVTNVRKVGNTVLMLDSDGMYWTVHMTYTHTGIQVSINVVGENMFVSMTGYLDEGLMIDASGSQIYSGRSVGVSLYVIPVQTSS